MKLNTFLLCLSFLVAPALPAVAQDRLSLPDAVARTLAHNPAARAATTAVGEATERVTQARAGYLPRVDLVESAQRGNQPVFAFGTLLSARQFQASDFAVGTLNRPDPTTSYHTGLAVEQPLFDGFRTQAAARSAAIARELAQTGVRRTRDDLVLGTTQAYGQVLYAQAAREAAGAAVKSAEEDLALAEHRRDAGMATEADALALRVHLAQMQERFIRASSDETIARAELNQAMGERLDRRFGLDDIHPPAVTPTDASALEQEAIAARPEVRAATLQQDLAREARRTARAAFLPQISLQGLLELNGNSGAFARRASAWTVGAQARWNLFSGLADAARLREAGLATERVAADRERVETGVRLEVLTASARVQSAAARGVVGQAAVAQARESQRIIRDRYDSGLASVTDVLRAANAVLDADSQRIGALVDLLVSQAMLDRALGRTTHVDTR